MEGVQIRALIGKGGETIKVSWRHWFRLVLSVDLSPEDAEAWTAN